MPPTFGWFCLKTDAAVKATSGFGAVGGAIRTCEWTWLTGFHKSIDITSPLQAELWSIFHGSQVAWSRGNMVADGMAKLTLPQSYMLHSFSDAPTSILPLVDRDTLGPPYIKLSVFR
ncbi:hypothetical protein F3Y22_tig00003151pilonHSYRG00116 [Hibiscus syriacus]|uniref:RNase H type-1 domain-containing protein n=1 Tax=Hibiscus syriacus TaxID=106335 RepID=A0A6A3CKF7_HIBSY|nr:hypothetical protein F3Y22_tig00003151pilonHSYRG00116 [Hibiscus syriacus]